MIIKKEIGPYLRSKYNRYRKLALALGLIGGLTIGLGLYFSQYTSAFVGAIIFMGSLPFISKALSYRLGIQGEKAVVEALQNLDNSYSLINDVMIGDKGGNIDHVLLSPKGIFVIETKNYSGEIRCNEDQWEKKVGYRLYEIMSVSSQAKNNARRLSNLIREKTNLTIFVQPICVFTNPSADLRLYKPTLPVLQVIELAHFIRQFPSMKLLSDTTIRSVSRCVIGEQ